MEKIAIDIVLLPPDDIEACVFEINQKAVADGSATIDMKKEQRIPHLSMLMGVMEIKKQKQIDEKMQSIAKQFSPLFLTASRAQRYALSIEKDATLQELHERLIADIEPLLTHDASKDMFHSIPGEMFEEKTCWWANEYVSECSFEKFRPHITTHSPDLHPTKFPLQFRASRLALCHLGNHNTCMKILSEFELQQ